MPGSYGQRRGNGASKPIELDQGEHVGDASIKLWKYASISGRITDDAGEPAVGVSVRVLRAQVSGPARTFVTGGTVQTDDRGMYRISTLIPGEYIVVVPQTVTTMPMSLVDAYYEASRAGTTSTLVRQLSESNAPFPSIGASLRVGDYQVGPTNGVLQHLQLVLGGDQVVVDERAAQALERHRELRTLVRPGSDGRRLSFAWFRRWRSRHVTGRRPVRNTGVRLIPVSVTGSSNDAGLETATTATDASGAFALLGVPLVHGACRSRNFVR